MADIKNVKVGDYVIIKQLSSTYYPYVYVRRCSNQIGIITSTNINWFCVHLKLVINPTTISDSLYLINHNDVTVIDKKQANLASI